MMFDGRGNKVIALFLGGKSDALDGKVITFGAAARKCYLGWTTAQYFSHLFTRAINGLHCVATQRIDAARIAILGCEKGQHNIQHTRVERGGSSVVKINGTFRHIFLVLLSSQSVIVFHSSGTPLYHRHQFSRVSGNLLKLNNPAANCNSYLASHLDCYT